MANSFEPTERTRARRRPQRASYDKDAIFAILDAGVICHLAYVVDGQPFCTPTAYWREGERVYWHGSSASRMLAAQAGGIPVCLAVSHLDGLVLGGAGFYHSLNYRSAMLFGRPALVADAAEKRRLTDAFIDRLYPGRSREIRPARDQELDAISVLGMTIEEASAKIRQDGVLEPPDEAAPGWAGVVSLASTVAAIAVDERFAIGAPVPPSLAAYTPGARLDDVLTAGRRSGAG